jgi:uncharacterized protein YoaH (UPF0181 family)
VKSQRNNKHKYTMTGNPLTSATQQAAIPRRINQLHEQITSNGEALNALTDKIKPVTQQVPEQPTDQAEDHNSCRLEEELQIATRRLRDQFEVLNHLIRNIQL